MVVSARELDRIRQAIDDGQHGETLATQISALTVNAAFECCCANWFWEATGNINGLCFFKQMRSKFPTLELINIAMRQGRQLQRTTDAFTPFPAEIYTLKNESDLTNDNFGLFQMRFSRSLERNGFGKELSRAIAAAFGEMADNIVQHARQPIQAHGVAAYQVTSRAACFTVTDVGQGMLKSLISSEKWSHLRTDREAILVAVCQGATSRLSANMGTGFKQVHKALASYNGTLRFRSGKSLLTLKGASEPKTAITESVAEMGGFQLFASCDLDNKKETFLLDSFH